MLRELARHEWLRLSGRPNNNPAGLLAAVRSLAEAATDDDATTSYWWIDGCAFDEEGAYSAAPPTVQTLLEALQVCGSSSLHSMPTWRRLWGHLQNKADAPVS